MRRFDKTKNILKANLLAEQRYLESKGLIKEYGDIEVGADKYDEMENLKKEANFVDNLTNLLKEGKYTTEFYIEGSMGDIVSYHAIAFDADKRLAYFLSDKYKLTLRGYDKGDGTTGPGMGDMGEIYYKSLSNGINVEVYENVDDPEELRDSDKPVFEFKYDNYDLYSSIFDNDKIEDIVRHNILNYKPD